MGNMLAINKALGAKRDALKANEEKGFTLIELLVVVLIIGILAAIAVPVYLGIQNDAREKAAIADLTTVRTAVVAYTTTNDGQYPATLLGATSDIADSVKLDENRWASIVWTGGSAPTASSTSWSITGTLQDGGDVYIVTDSAAPAKQAAPVGGGGDDD
jgi:type IV pilus assembly protein PilA